METPEYWLSQIREHKYSKRLDLRMCLHALHSAGIIDPYEYPELETKDAFERIDEKYPLEVH